MNCCENSGNKESKESPEGVCCSIQPEKKISWLAWFMVLFIVGILLFNLFG